MNRHRWPRQSAFPPAAEAAKHLIGRTAALMSFSCLSMCSSAQPPSLIRCLAMCYTGPGSSGWSRWQSRCWGLEESGPGLWVETAKEWRQQEVWFSADVHSVCFSDLVSSRNPRHAAAAALLLLEDIFSHSWVRLICSLFKTFGVTQFAFETVLNMQKDC